MRAGDAIQPTSTARLLFAQFSLAVRELSAATRTAEVLDILRRATRAVSGARGVTVVLREGDLCHYLADDAESALWPDQRFPMESCISGWAMLNGAPAVVPDIYADPRIPHDVYRPTFVRSLIMTPMGEEQAYAALGAYWDHVRDHSDQDVQLLGALAGCAAGALDRIRMSEALRALAPRGDHARTGVDAAPGAAVAAVLKERDGQLAEAHSRLNAIMDNATVAIFLMDERQQCAYMNAAAEKLTGYSLAETLGRPLHDVVHHTRPDGSPYPLEECPIDRAFPERAQVQGEEVFVHKDGSFYPVAFTASPILDAESRTIGTIIEVQDIRQRKQAEAQQALLMREVDHRSRNVLTVVQSLVRLTNADDPGRFREVVSGRIDALARAQAFLSEGDWHGASLAEILLNEVVSVGGRDRLSLEGDAVMVRVEHVQPLSMLFHELATNAVKYGSLSVEGGQVNVRWTVRGRDAFRLTWCEEGGPPVASPPTRAGFGSRLMEQLGRQLRARLQFDWRADGLVVTLELP